MYEKFFRVQEANSEETEEDYTDINFVDILNHCYPILVVGLTMEFL